MESSNADGEFNHSFFAELAYDTAVDGGDSGIQQNGNSSLTVLEARRKRKLDVAVGRNPCPDTRDWCRAKRERSDQKKIVVKNDMIPFDINVNQKSAATAIWRPELGLAEISQMRGNFWRTSGFAVDKSNFLYPEEVLLLAERAVVLVEYEGSRIEYHKLYKDVIGRTSLECYLAYIKLKSLDYIVFRHDKIVRSFEGDADVYMFLKSHPEQSLLKALVSYDVYTHTHKWSKKNMISESPTAYVIVITGDWTFSGRLLIRLLEEANGVPLIFAACMPTGHVMLEEFSDSMKALNWDNVFAKPISFNRKVEDIIEVDVRGTVTGEINEGNIKVGISTTDIEMIEEGEGGNEDEDESAEDDDDEDDEEEDDDNNEREIVDDSDSDNGEIKHELSNDFLSGDLIESFMNQDENLAAPLNSFTQIEDSATFNMTNS